MVLDETVMGRNGKKNWTKWYWAKQFLAEMVLDEMSLGRNGIGRNVFGPKCLLYPSNLWPHSFPHAPQYAKSPFCQNVFYELLLIVFYLWELYVKEFVQPFS